MKNQRFYFATYRVARQFAMGCYDVRDGTWWIDIERFRNGWRVVVEKML